MKNKCYLCGSTEKVNHYVPSGDVCDKCANDPEQIAKNWDTLKRAYSKVKL